MKERSNLFLDVISSKSDVLFCFVFLLKNIQFILTILQQKYFQSLLLVVLIHSKITVNQKTV